MPTELLTSVGRMVWGHPAKLNAKTDQRTNQKILKDGKEIMVSAVGIAFPKADFGQYIWPYMAKEIATGYPNGAPRDFSYKYKDGDGVDRTGKPYALREGWAGCYVLTISTEAFTPTVYKLENGVYRQLSPEEYKTGDYFRARINLVLNIPKAGSTNTPSIYVNPMGLELVGYGTAIFTGPDAQTMFGGQAAALPPGASATPIATPGAPGMPGMPPSAVPGGTSGMMPQGYPQPAPGAAAPMPGLQPGGMPAGYPAPGMPPGQPGYPPQGYPPAGMAPQGPPVTVQSGPPGGYPPQYPPPGAPPSYAPAHDFVAQATGGYVPGQMPMPGAPQGVPPGQPGYPPQQMQPSAPMPGQAPLPGFPQGYPPPGNR